MQSPTPPSPPLIDLFDDVFDSEIAPRLKKRDKEREAFKKKSLWNWLLVLAAAAVVTVGFYAVSRDADSYFFAFPAGGAAYWYLIARPKKRLLESVKRDIFSPLCDALGFTYHLYPDGSKAGYFTELGLGEPLQPQPLRGRGFGQLRRRGLFAGRRKAQAETKQDNSDQECFTACWPPSR